MSRKYYILELNTTSYFDMTACNWRFFNRKMQKKHNAIIKKVQFFNNRRLS